MKTNDYKSKASNAKVEAMENSKDSNSKGKRYGKYTNRNSGKNSQKSRNGQRSGKANNGGYRSKFENDQRSGSAPINTKDHNDPMWYTFSPELAQSVANWPYPQPMGLPLDIKRYVTDNATMLNYERKVKYGEYYATAPGILTIDYLPALGKGDFSWSDPINVSLLKMWQVMRASQSGVLSFSPAAFGMYYLSVVAAWEVLECIKRAYYLWNLTYAQNRYLPEGLSYALGFDPADLRANAQVLVSRITHWEAAINAYHIPSSIKYPARKLYLAGNVFVEDPDASQMRTQFYVFRPESVWNWDWNNNKMTLTTLPFGTQDQTVEAWATVMDGIIANLSNITDIANISAMVDKAYSDNIWRFPQFVPYSVLELRSDNFILNQIHNMVVLGDVYGQAPTSTIEIVEDTTEGPTFGTLKANYTNICGSNYNMPYVPIFDTRELISPELILESTRLAPVYSVHLAHASAQKVYIQYDILSCGTELPRRLHIITFDNSATSRVLDDLTYPNSVPIPTGGTVTLDAFMVNNRAEALLDSFRYAPMLTGIWYCNNTGSTDDTTIADTSFSSLTYPKNVDYNYLYTPQASDLARIEDEVFLSLFDPLYGHN